MRFASWATAAARRGLFCFLCSSGILCFPASAQNRPLRTVDAELVSPGTLRVEVGLDFLQDVDFPLSGLSGDLTSVGVLGVRVGLGKIVEIQLQGTVHHFLDIERQSVPFVPLDLTGPRSTRDFGDFAVFTKVRIFEESGWRPALATRFGVQLPISNASRGIGTNTTDVLGVAVLQKGFGKLTLAGNLGLGILQAPNSKLSQNDVLLYGAAFTYALHPRINLVGEVAGHYSVREIHVGLVGTESRSQAHFGFQIEAGGFSWDLAGITGLARPDARVGFTFGVRKDIRLFNSNRRQ